MRFAAVVALVLVLGTPVVHGYAVRLAVPLEQLAKEADLVCKATVIDDAVVVDPAFPSHFGYEVRETRLRVVSVIAGSTSARTIRFRHYAEGPADQGRGPYAPQSHVFVRGRTYIVFAKAVSGDLFKQHAMDHTAKGDQGVVLAATDKRHRGRTVTEAVRAELAGLLASGRPDDVTYAMRQLDDLSGGNRTGLSDLPRKASLDAIRSVLRAKDDGTVRAALEVFGADSPYFRDDFAPFWLAGMGKGYIGGMGTLEPRSPPAADLARKELLALARTRPTLRALAIRALGPSPAIPDATLVAWTRDPDVEVRAAAILVSSSRSDRAPIKRGAADPEPKVRAATALAIGFTQDASLIATLATLIRDPSLDVQSPAALALLSFDPAVAGPTMHANVASEWGALFVNVLAKPDPTPYLARLADVVENSRVPRQWWGGRTPAADSWDLLYRHVKQVPADELRRGTHDRWLDALEKLRWFSSAEPRDLYALYVSRNMTERAKRLRAATRKVFSDAGTQWDQVDKAPEQFVR